MTHFRFSAIALLCLSSSLVAANSYQLEKIEASEQGDTYWNAKERAADKYSTTLSSEAQTQVYTREDIEKLGASTAWDVIANGTSVATSYQGRKSQFFFKVRGGGTFGVIVDGVYVANSGWNTYLNELSADFIEEIKIVRDATVLTFAPMTSVGGVAGSNVEGFIVITTRKPMSEKIDGVAKMHMETRGGNGATGLVGSNIGNAYWQIMASRTHTDGIKDWNQEKDVKSVMLKSGYANGGFSIDGSVYADYGKQDMQRYQNNVGVSASNVAMKWGYDPSWSKRVAIAMQEKWSNKQITAASFYYDEAHKDETDASYINSTATYTKQKQFVKGGELKHTMIFGDNITRFGVQALSMHVPSGMTNYTGVERREKVMGAFIQDEWAIIPDKFTIDAGARVDKHRLDVVPDKYNATTVAANAQYIKYKWLKDAQNFTVGSWLAVTKDTRLNARISYSLQPADNSVIKLNNKDFQDEKRWRYEAGVESKLSKTLSGSTTLFLYDTKNEKYSAGTVTSGSNNGSTIYGQQNGKRYGVEFTVKSKPMDGVTLDANYAYMYSEIANYTYPNQIYGATAQYKKGDFESNLVVKYISDYSGATPNGGAGGLPYYDGLGNFTTVDANINYDFKAAGLDNRITVYGKNMLNDHYATVYYFQNVGAIYGVSYRVKF